MQVARGTRVNNVRNDRISMSSTTQLRVATAAILIPGVAVAVLWGPTWVVAGLAALVAVFALLEFFSLGERICFYSYRTLTCLSAGGVFSQQLRAAQAPTFLRPA